MKDDKPVKMSEDVERAENIKKALLAETQKLEKLSETIYQQNNTLLTAREGILLGRDRTKLYTAHRFKLEQVRPRSKAIFQGAQYDARQRLAYQARQKDNLAQAVFKNVFSVAQQVHNTLVEAVENLAPGGVYKKPGRNERGLPDSSPPARAPPQPRRTAPGTARIHARRNRGPQDQFLHTKLDDLLQDDYDAVEEVNLAEPNEKKDDTATPSERHVPKYQAGESAREAAKLKPPQAVEQVPRNRQVKLQGILSGNNKDGGHGENFQVGNEAHAQNSYTVAYPLTGGHFWLTSNYGATR